MTKRMWAVASALVLATAVTGSVQAGSNPTTQALHLASGPGVQGSPGDVWRQPPPAGGPDKVWGQMRPAQGAAGPQRFPGELFQGPPPGPDPRATRQFPGELFHGPR
ncbi:hypothetical protein [Thioalkalivibrio paradoxus]|nr:hypothetical protein [Thioalkalivibrio paradoxus]